MSRKILVEGSIGCALLCTAALARADDFDWTSINVGVNGGFTWGSQDPLNLLTSGLRGPTFTFSGGTVGGTAGAQIQREHVVLGLEIDIDWVPISATTHLVVHPLNQSLEGDVNLDIHAVSTARARAGYAQGPWLFFLTGGLAVIEAETDLTNLAGGVCGSQDVIRCTGPKWRVGGAAGGGVEFMFAPAWSATVEYLRVGGIALEFTRLNTIRAGLNYRFGR